MFFRSKQIAALNSLLRSVTSERDMLEQHVRDLQEENEQLHKFVKNCEEVLKKNKESFQFDDLYIDHLEKENKSLTSQIDDLYLEIARLKEENNQLLEIQQALIAKCNELHKSLENYMDEKLDEF